MRELRVYVSLLFPARFELRNTADRRAQSVYAASVSREADRARPIITMRQRTYPDRHCSRSTAARTARRSARVPRVVCPAVKIVVGKQSGGKARHVRTAEDHRTGFSQIGHDGAVIVDDVVFERHYTVGRRAIGIVDVDFYRDGNAVQGAKRLPIPYRFVGQIGCSKSLFGQKIDYRVDAGVHLLHPPDTARKSFTGGYSSRPDAIRKFGGTPPPQISGHRMLPRTCGLLRLPVFAAHGATLR